MANVKRDSITKSIFKILKVNLETAGYKVKTITEREMAVGNYMVRIVANSKPKTDGNFSINRIDRAIEVEKADLNQLMFRDLANSGVTGLRALELNTYDFIIGDIDRNEYTVKVISPRSKSVDSD